MQRIWHSELMECINSTVLEKEVTAMAFSPDGSRIALAHAEGGVRVLLAADLSLDMRFHVGGDIHHLAFSHDGQILAASSTHGYVVFGELRTGVLICAKLWAKANFAGLSAVGEDEFVAISLHGRRCTIHLDRKTMTATIKAIAFPFFTDSVECVATSHDGSKVAYYLCDASKPRVLMIRDLQTDQNKSFDHSADHIAWSRDGSAVATAAGKSLYIMSSKDSISNWTRTTALAFSANGKFLAQGTDTFVHFWRTERGKPPFGIDIHTSVSCVQFNPDGRTMAGVATDKKTLSLWRLHSQFHLEAAATAAASSSSTTAAEPTAAIEPKSLAERVAERIRDLEEQNTDLQTKIVDMAAAAVSTYKPVIEELNCKNAALEAELAKTRDVLVKIEVVLTH